MEVVPIKMWIASFETLAEQHGYLPSCNSTNVWVVVLLETVPKPLPLGNFTVHYNGTTDAIWEEREKFEGLAGDPMNCVEELCEELTECLS